MARLRSPRSRRGMQLAGPQPIEPALLPMAGMRSPFPDSLDPLDQLRFFQQSERDYSGDNWGYGGGQGPISAPALTPAEEQSYLSKAAGALSYIGETLDKPGAAVRGVLGGQGPAALANLIPFSDTMGLTNAPAGSQSVFGTEPLTTERVSGRQLLEQQGLVGPNEPGDTWGELGRNAARGLAGFGAEVATDPLLWVTGPLGTVSKGAGEAIRGTEALATTGADVTKAIGQATKAVLQESPVVGQTLTRTPLAMAEQFRSGQRGLAGLRLPWQAEPFAQTSFGLGGKVAKVIEKAAYGPVAGKVVGGLRYVFSPVVGSVPLDQHKIRDAWWAVRQRNMDALENMSVSYSRNSTSLLREMQDIAKYHGAQDDALGLDRFVRGIAETKGKMPDPREIEPLFRDHLKISADAPLDVVRDSTMSLGQSIGRVADQMLETQDAWYKHYLELGGSGEMLDDLAGRQFPRRPSHPEYFATAKQAKARLEMRGYRPDPRNPLYRHIPGNTATLNDMTQDAVFGGSKADLLAAVQAIPGVQIPANVSRKALAGMYVEHAYLRDRLTEEAKAAMSPENLQKWEDYWFKPTTLVKKPRKGGSPVLKEGPTRAVQLGQKLSRMPKVVRENGLFDRFMVDDSLDYQRSLLERISTLQTAHHFLGGEGMVLRDGTGMSLAKAWKDAGFKIGNASTDAPTGIYKFIADHFKDEVGDDPAAFLKTLTVAPGVENAIKGYAKMIQPAEAGPMLKAFDKITAYFKGAFTVPRPAFHSRNLQAGQWANMVEGHASPAEIARGSIDAAKRFLNPTKYPTEHDDTLKLMGLGAGHGMVADISSELAAEAAAKEVRPFRETITWKPWEFRGATSPYRVGKRKFDDMADAQRFARSTGGEVTQAKQFLPMAMGEKAYSFVESVNREGYALALLRKGFTPAQAKHLVNRTQFDYGALSPIEKTWFKRTVPFWTWLRKNVPYQFSKLLERPGGATAQTIRGMGAAINADESYVPAYLREGVGMRSPFAPGPPEGANYIRSMGLPLEDLNKMTFYGNAPDLPRTRDKLMAGLHPLALALLEPMMGRQLFTGRNLKDLDSATGYPKLDALLHYSPVSAVAGEVQSWLDPRKTLAQKAINFATGIKTTTVDAPKSRLLDLQRALERKADESPMVRRYTNLYVPKRFRTEAEAAEAQKLLKQSGRLEQTIKKLRKQQQLQGV